VDPPRRDSPPPRPTPAEVARQAMEREANRRRAAGYRNLLAGDHLEQLRFTNNHIRSIGRVLQPALNLAFGAGSVDIVNNLAAYGIPFEMVTEARCLSNFAREVFNNANIQNQAWACDPIRNANLWQLANLLDDPSIGQNLAANIGQNYWTGNGTCAPFINSYVNFAENNCPHSVVRQCRHLFSNRACPQASVWARSALARANTIRNRLGF